MNMEMTGQLIYWFVLYGLILYAVDDLVRKSKVMSFLFMVAPLLFLPLLMQTVFTDWFNVLKFSTLMIVPVYITMVRFKWSHKWLLIFGALLLPINIVEAVLKDVELGNWINVVSGIIAIGVLPTPNKLTVTGKQDFPEQISYPMSWVAIGAFTLWHLCLIYSFPSFRGYAGDYVVMDIPTLLIPIVAALTYGSRYWLQARAYTMAFNVLMLEATVVNHPDYWPLTPNIYDPTVYTVISIVTFGLISAGWIYLAHFHREHYAQTIFGTLLKTKTGRQSS